MSNRQTVFFLPVDPTDKNHKDPDKIDLNAPRLAQYMHKAWKKHQNTVFWVDINLAQKKGLKFYQTRSNAIILYETLPAFCIPKVVRMETGEVIDEKVFLSPRPPPKISLKHDWMKESGSEVVRQPEGEVAQQSKSSQSNQPNPNPDHDRTEKPVVCPQRGAERPGRPVVNDKDQRSQGMTNVLSHIYCVPSNVQFSHQEALLNVFEDNEAVMMIIIKGRSRTMRHVSRTHRVALDWLFDRINLDPKNPNQVHRYQKPTCRHPNQRKFHT